MFVASRNRNVEFGIVLGYWAPDNAKIGQILKRPASEGAKEFPVQVINLSETKNVMAAHNSLAGLSKADILVLGMPTSLMMPSAIDRILNSLDQHKNVAMADSRHIPVESARDIGFNSPATSWCSRALMAVRRNVFQEVGGFDENFFPSDGGDVDLSWNIRLAGYSIHHAPSSVIYNSNTILSEGPVLDGTNQNFSPLTRLLLAWKWSRDDILSDLLKGNVNQETKEESKAKSEFLKMKELGTLPKRLDAPNLIGSFETPNYSFQRVGDGY
jgi:hypothetical protein